MSDIWILWYRKAIDVATLAIGVKYMIGINRTFDDMLY
jgi:hypothetical protein